MKKELKGFLVGVIVTMMLGSTMVFADTVEVLFNTVNIAVNGQKVIADNILYNGRTYVPLAAIAQMFGKDVVWDGSTNTANINEKGSTVAPPSTTAGQDEYIVKDSSGKALYSIKINKITAMIERNKFSDKNPAQVLLVDYTYKNIASNKEVYLGDIYFKIIDSKGKIGYTYPNMVTKYPQKIIAGVTCDAQMVFGIDNSSSKVKVCFYEDLFGDMTTSFEIPVN